MLPRLPVGALLFLKNTKGPVSVSLRMTDAQQENGTLSSSTTSILYHFPCIKKMIIYHFGGVTNMVIPSSAQALFPDYQPDIRPAPQYPLS